jgi:hypothetical protein
MPSHTFDFALGSPRRPNLLGGLGGQATASVQVPSFVSIEKNSLLKKKARFFVARF